MSKTEVIKLEYPVQLADKEIKEITIRRITLGDNLDIDSSELSGEAELLSRLTGLKVEELRMLDWMDYVKLQDCLTRFQTGIPLQTLMVKAGSKASKAHKI